MLAQEEWKEEHSDARRRAVRRAIAGEDDDGVQIKGVVAGAGKEDGWILGLLGIFGSSGFVGRDVRQDAAYGR